MFWHSLVPQHAPVSANWKRMELHQSLCILKLRGQHPWTNMFQRCVKSVLEDLGYQDFLLILGVGEEHCSCNMWRSSKQRASQGFVPQGPFQFLQHGEGGMRITMFPVYFCENVLHATGPTITLYEKSWGGCVFCFSWYRFINRKLNPPILGEWIILGSASQSKKRQSSSDFVFANMLPATGTWRCQENVLCRSQ